MKCLKLFRSFDKLPFLPGFAVKIPYEDDPEVRNEHIFAVTIGPFIINFKKFFQLDKDERNFIFYHEMGHVRQFYWTFGLSTLIFMHSLKYSEILEKLADKFAEKKTGLSAKNIRKRLEYKEFK